MDRNSLSITERAKSDYTKYRKNLKKKYKEIFETINYYPTILNLSELVGVSEDDVKFDLKKYNLLLQYRKLNSILNRLALVKPKYEEYYIDKKYTKYQMADLLKCSVVEVEKDIEELKNRYGLDIMSEVVCDNSNKDNCNVRNIFMDELKKSDKNKYLSYLKNNSNNFILLEEMAVYFDKSIEEMILELEKFDLLEDYKSICVGRIEFLNRYIYYKNYIKKGYCLCSAEELSAFLSIPLDIVDLDVLKMQNEFGVLFKDCVEDLRVMLDIKIDSNGNIIDLNTNSLIFECKPFSKSDSSSLSILRDNRHNEVSSNIDCEEELKESIEEEVLDVLFSVPNMLNSGNSMLSKVVEVDDSIEKDENIVLEEDSCDRQVVDLTDKRKLELDEYFIRCYNSYARVNKENSKQITTFEERSYLYNKLISKLKYVPYVNVISNKLGFSVDLIEEDLKRLNLKPQRIEDYNSKVEEEDVKDKALENKSFYELNFFNAEKPLSINEMSIKLKYCESSVKNQIKYLEENFGLSLKSKGICDFSNIKNAKNAEDRKEYYISNYFNINLEVVKSPSEMAEELGITVKEVYIDLDYLEKKYRFINPNYVNKVVNDMVKEDSLLEGEIEEFLKKNYFFAENPLTVEEISNKLSMNKMDVFSNIGKMVKKGYKVKE